MVGGKKDQDAEKLLAAQSKRAQGGKEDARTWVNKAEELVGQIKAAGRKLLPLLVKQKKTEAEATQIGKLKQELEQKQEQLKEPIQKIQETIGSTCSLAGSCFVTDTPVHTLRGTTPLEKLAHGRQVITYLPGEAPVQPSRPESIDPATWRHIRRGGCGSRQRTTANRRSILT